MKGFAGRNLQKVANLGVQLHGGAGFTHEYASSVHLPDSQLYGIGEGAGDVLLISTGAALLGK